MLVSYFLQRKWARAARITEQVERITRVKSAFIAYHIWSDIVKGLFTAQSSKLVSLFSLRRYKRDVQVRVFASSFENSCRKCHFKWNRLRYTILSWYKATLVGAPDADILAAAIEGAIILADKATSDPKVGKEWCQRTNRAVWHEKTRAARQRK